MEKKQSSIDWLEWQINLGLSERGLISAFKEAKAMHKEEVVKASALGYMMGAEGFPLEVAHHYGQQWYKNEFEGGENE